MTTPKFCVLGPAGESLAHDYGNIFFRQPCGESERLVIGPSGGQVRLLEEMAASFPTENIVLLYILLVSQTGRMPGRYQSPFLEGLDELRSFLETFRAFLEGDGRHHLWVASPDSSDLLVYDQHDVIFAYGELDKFESILKQKGFKKQKFWFPSPHVHSYDSANIKGEEALLSFFDWHHSELRPGDEWD